MVPLMISSLEWALSRELLKDGPYADNVVLIAIGSLPTDCGSFQGKEL